MAATISTTLAIYFLVWWLTFLASLPWGVRAQGEEGAPGTDPGAPVSHGMWRRLAWTTVISAVIYAVALVIVLSGFLTMDDIINLYGPPALT